MDIFIFLLVMFVVVFAVLAVVGWRRMRNPAGLHPRMRELRTAGGHSEWKLCIKTMAVLGTGGHTTEMALLLKHLDRRHYLPLVFLYTSDFCLQTIEKIEQEKGNAANCEFLKISRSRKVGQPWLSSIFTTAYAIPRAVMHVLRQKPDLLLINGPGVCIPVCVGAVLLNILFQHRCAIVFIESICRVQKLSLTGKILRFVATSFFVQWPVPGIPAHAVCLADDTSCATFNSESGSAGSEAKERADSFGQGHCFVTVGSTNFDKMIRTLDNEASVFLDSLRKLGVKSATIQIGGTSEIVPEETALYKLKDVRVVRILPHSEFLEEVQKASLMVGHAGAGTILESLSNGKRLLVVPNQSLMDNHQRELCEAVAGKYCLSCTEDDILSTLQQAHEAFKKVSCALPPHLTTAAFAKKLERMFGLA